MIFKSFEVANNLSENFEKHTQVRIKFIRPASYLLFTTYGENKNMTPFKPKNIFSTIAILMITIFVVSMFALPNTTTTAQNIPTPQSHRGLGQIAMAHWTGVLNTDVTIDAYFAEQLTTPTGEVIRNGLYIKVIHGNGVESEDQIALNDSAIIKNQHEIQIETSMNFAQREGSTPTPHSTLLVWNLDENFARITLGNHPSRYGNSWDTESFTIDTVATPTASAAVTKEKGNTNTLAITVTAPYFDFQMKNTQTTTLFESFTINNNAANTYTINNYRVYVDTKGNDQIRACYIATK